MTHHARVAFLLKPLAAFMFCGCGGVMDSVATHELDLRVSTHAHALRNRPVSVAMRTYENVPFTKPQKVTTDSAGHARAEFRTGWGGAFLIIPPVGSVPSHPPKPIYAVTVAGKRIFLSPDTTGVTYRWENASWHTEASVSLP